MIRFWFQFDCTNSPAFILGYGVTAINYDDAISILKEKAFKNQEMPEITKFIENVDVSTLDSNHIIPNIMKSSSVRGIWFPIGYD